MTTLAFDGEQLASDSAATAEDGAYNRIAKIAVLEVNAARPHLGHISLALFGAVGQLDALAQVAEFLRGDRKTLDLKHHSEAIIVTPEGAWLWARSRPIPLLTGAKTSIGSGAKAALGAMFMGASASRAVEIACSIDAHTEGPVQVFVLPPKPEQPDDR